MNICTFDDMPPLCRKIALGFLVILILALINEGTKPDRRAEISAEQKRSTEYLEYCRRNNPDEYNRKMQAREIAAALRGN